MGTSSRNRRSLEYTSSVLMTYPKTNTVSYTVRHGETPQWSSSSSILTPIRGRVGSAWDRQRQLRILRAVWYSPSDFLPRSEITIPDPTRLPPIFLTRYPSLSLTPPLLLSGGELGTIPRALRYSPLWISYHDIVQESA
jgi:hypothetical protein